MRNKNIRELRGRYDEVVSYIGKPPTNPAGYYQFLTIIAHYVEYIQTHRLTKKAIHSLIKQKESLDADEVLIKDAETIIKKAEADLEVITTIAKEYDINTSKVDIASQPGGAIGEDIVFRIRLGNVSEYLNLDPDQQEVTELPRMLENLSSAAFTLTNLGVEMDKVRPLIDACHKMQNDYSKKLTRQNLRKNFLRLDDYNEIAKVKRYIYQESDRDESLWFSFDNADLIDISNSKVYNSEDMHNVEMKTNEYLTHVQRLNNHLLNSLEHIPWYERMGAWLLQHLGPTLASVIILALVWALLWRMGIHLDLMKLFETFIKS